jgi:hypothetical protein
MIETPRGSIEIRGSRVVPACIAESVQNLGSSLIGFISLDERETTR